MGKMERIRNFIVGLGMIVSAAVMILFPDFGYLLVGTILSFMLMIAGIRNLIYYRSMARHMVGGRRIFYTGLLLLDMGIFAGGLVAMNGVYVMLYLLGGYAFSGLVHILRAFEAKEYSFSAWIRTLSNGIFDLAIAVLCLFFYQSQGIMVIIYCIGLVHSAILRIRSAFRRSAIVYIQ